MVPFGVRLGRLDGGPGDAQAVGVNIVRPAGHGDESTRTDMESRAPR